ncbi:hypothetical protein OIU76_012209 [Salix suchowensis]|uniref:Uncharacterized protein n=2 Tax=Salix TaxID=40685 RepID=A0A9Q0WUX1_9ROSI|nr:hypothetical protein OIU77_013637 [Salix suchowensis]KAJ6325081.1 hypothetical protein OIU76_012209 [Salix suchowensis]KAJ6357534.1 hypothetical protein OIU78_005394 [Salix suchowensis]KAJ6772598.1 hypothetical protein OIU74_018755 [Salix koriyanagi]
MASNTLLPISDFDTFDSVLRLRTLAAFSLSLAVRGDLFGLGFVSAEAVETLEPPEV